MPLTPEPVGTLAISAESSGALTLNPRTDPRGAYAGIAYAGQAYASQTSGLDLSIQPEPVGSL